jgi:hypothetical protein
LGRESREPATLAANNPKPARCRAASANPKGIASSSPRLRGSASPARTELPWVTVRKWKQPQRGCDQIYSFVVATNYRNRVAVVRVLPRSPMVGASAPTSGFLGHSPCWGWRERNGIEPGLQSARKKWHKSAVGFYIRKSLSVGPFRFNLSKSGIGLSTGIKGFRIGTGPRGNYVHMDAGGGPNV